MSAGARVAVAGPSIPANARKVVQDLKEIVKNSDDEIYAMLKDCNMDPNETVQRLLSQDTFHEVKRKRDKKKEVTHSPTVFSKGLTIVNVNKDSGEPRSRPSGVSFSVRGGRISDRGTGRGNYIPRYNSDFQGNGRGQPFSGRDDGLHQNVRASSTTPALVQPQAQTKFSSSGTSNTVTAVTSSGLAGLPNGSSPYPRTSLAPQGSWSLGPGQTTMADIVKSKSTQQYDVIAAPVSKVSTPEQVNSLSSNVSAGVHTPSTDSMLHSYLESHGMGPVGVKQDAEMVRSQIYIGEQAHVLSTEDSPIADSSKQLPQIADGFGAFSSESGGTAVDSDIAPTSVLHSFSEEPKISQLPSMEMEVVGSSEGASFLSSLGPPGPAVSRGALNANAYNGRAMYQTQQQPVGSQKGSGLEWKPKSPVQGHASSQAVVEASSLHQAAVSSPPASPEDSTRTLLDSTSKLQRLSMHDDQPVIIPNHFQVPEADRTHLSFGSFGEDFDTSLPSNFASEDDNKNSASVADNSSAIEAQAEQPITSSLQSFTTVSLEENDTNLSTVSPVEALVGGDDVAISMPAPVVMPLASRQEVLKAEPVVQQSQQYPYLSAMPSYPGFGVMPQLMSGQYTYEPAESQPQEVSRLPSFVSHYSDPNVNYYSPVFRPSSDVDARYNSLVSTNATNKYTGGTLITGQGLSSSQEGGNSIVIPASGPTGQTSQQTVGVAQTGLSMPQQPVQIHAYPTQHAGVPFTPFGASVFGLQYLPSSYGYMPTAYQHSYTGNTGYAQVPSGSSYAPTAASAYTPSGGTAIKYSLPQYKPGAAVVNTPHAALAAGYGSFTTSPTGFATVNPAVTTVTASGYDDVSGRQYKENNLYIPSQQAEGSTVWIQTPLSREAGAQTNSFYNMLGQGQHTGYAHTQPTHAVPAAAYANLYHQSQSGTAPTVQLLQQPQALGAIGGGVAQSGAYPQPQRGQLSWTNNY